VVHPLQQGADGVGAGDGLCPTLFVGLPLADMQGGLVDIGVAQGLQTHIIEALKGAHAGGTHGDSLTVVVEQFLQGLPSHGHILCVHGMSSNIGALHRTEGAGSDMESELFTVNTVVIDG